MTNKLLQILDFSHAKSTADVVTHAELVARELMQNWKISSFGQERAFLGLEFYIWIPEIHEDTSVHKRSEQQSKGCFYFHTNADDPKWAPPIFNRHGVDITCGDQEKNIFGGILLRHLGGVGNTDGSGKALRAIMRGDDGFKTIPQKQGLYRWTEEELNIFKSRNKQSIFGGPIELVHRHGHYQGKIESRPRIGIENKSHARELLRFVASF